MRDKERNTLVHAAARGGLPALAMDLVDMLGADAIGLQNAQGESALNVASGLSGVGMALMRRAPAEVLRTMDMTRVPWLHQSLRTLVVPLLLNNASVTSVDLSYNHLGASKIGDAGARDLAEALKVNTAVTSIELNSTSVPAPAGGAGGERG